MFYYTNMEQKLSGNSKEAQKLRQSHEDAIKDCQKILNISNRSVAFERERKMYEELIDAGYTF